MNLRDLYQRLREAMAEGHYLCVTGVVGEFLVYIRDTFCPEHTPGPMPVGAAVAADFDPTLLTGDELEMKIKEACDHLTAAKAAGEDVQADNAWVGLLVVLLQEVIRRFLSR